MPKKLTFEYIKEFINKENLLISNEYINSNTKLKIECNNCKEIYNQTFSLYSRGHRHQKCSNSITNTETSLNALRIRYNNKIFIKDTIKQCIICDKKFILKNRTQKFCSKNCYTLFIKTDIEYLKNQKINGSIGGTKSAKSQQLRGKAEIYFSELCIAYFGKDDIICNERIFKDFNGNLWDCDIFIKSLKIAILYDGIHHYKKIYKNQKLDQIRTRDKIKRSVILDNGYTYYTIKDLGSFNTNFVENQFNLFIHKLYFKKVLDLIKT
jgi:hypothetical protein